ncbi:MAG: peptidylprolyl isomerase [Prevotella sp.]|nr:peptidylprolyl isomerase [Prevotella sp.]
MKAALLLVACQLSPAAAVAQQADPVLMTVAGQSVTRSEFEYSYNKNNADGVIDRKTVDEYVELFVNYKLKVQAALDARLDTLSSFQAEFAQYRDQQVRPTFVTDADVEAEARRFYDQRAANIGDRGLIHPAHILLRVYQKATDAEREATRVRIDSIYQALLGGADFGQMATRFSQDPGSAPYGGLLPWIEPNQTLQEFEDAAYALQAGEMSKPVLSAAGYHIILMKERRQLAPFDSLKAPLIKMLERRNVRDHLVNAKLDTLVSQSGGQLTRGSILAARADSMAAADPELRYLIREYHDGLLVYEMTNRTVWEPAARDEQALATYYKKHKKKYAWTEPRFKGIAYHVKDAADVAAVKRCVKGLKYADWNEALRNTFNRDSIRIRVEKGLFKQGDNALIDKQVFKVDTTVTPVEGFPIDATFGKVLKKGPEDYTDVKGLVTADWQEELERQWVADLRRRYTVTVDPAVLKTVNKHQ